MASKRFCPNCKQYVYPSVDLLKILGFGIISFIILVVLFGLIGFVFWLIIEALALISPWNPNRHCPICKTPISELAKEKSNKSEAKSVFWGANPAQNKKIAVVIGIILIFLIIWLALSSNKVNKNPNNYITQNLSDCNTAEISNVSTQQTLFEPPLAEEHAIIACDDACKQAGMKYSGGLGAYDSYGNYVLVECDCKCK